MWVVPLAFIGIGIVSAQYTSQTYPDPRLDPITCRLPLSSYICDPSSILSDEERLRLVERVNQFRTMTAGIRNTSPACAIQPDRSLDIFVIVIDKIGSIPGAPVDIEKFTNNLKRRFQNYQDISACDTTVLIVNSKQDRQVFTVAGRDTRIPKDTLRNAFERNIGYFKAGNYAMGIEGMVELIVATYSNAHIMQIPRPDNQQWDFDDFLTVILMALWQLPTCSYRVVATPDPTKFVPDIRSTPETVAPFRAAGLPNSVHPVKVFSSNSAIEINENDKVWVTIMQQAVARCGSEPELLPVHVRAVVEEAMSISLKLISDSRYNSIEEEVEARKDVTGIRERWDQFFTAVVSSAIIR
ncbi:unnamed protein product [Angiostrongylus costaricensis]|uniref:VWFA domain-containing protein n=1 Tax=Angiostrongylus costaricensis TaxID=334426 RepID=A0A158PER6_ANGCS|nr:unnamed protein product [Angiostrongylus costaricensis]